MKRLILLLLVLLLMPLVIAETQTLGVFKQNTCVNLVQVCSNCSYNYVKILYPNSSTALNTVRMTKDGNYYSYEVCNKSSLLGKYIAQGVGDLDGSNQSWTYDYYITPNGELLSTASSVSYFLLIGVLVFFLIVCIVMLLNMENTIIKVASISTGYILLIAILFISWQMSLGFITANSFLVKMLYILFMTLMIGAFPLLIGFFAYYIIQIIRTKEIAELMERGLPEEDARRKLREYGKY